MCFLATFHILQFGFVIFWQRISLQKPSIKCWWNWLKDTIGWEEYRQLVYGFLDDPEGTPDGEDDDSFSYKYVAV